ncbi:Hsp20/alpha crystallin family protein [Sulfurifustis variabilis]|nr:Hsp20/alpha crystallin family protein [Sulfurifustis variabilis]
MAEAKKETGKKEMQRATPARALSPFEEMERMFESAWMRPWAWKWPGRLAAPFEGRMPSVDVVDRDDEVLVRAELPGVDKKDLDVAMSDNAITIKGTSSREEKEEKGEYYRHEISRGSFSRTVTLPAQIDGEKAKAEFKDGILEIHLPKLERSKRHHLDIE